MLIDCFSTDSTSEKETICTFSKAVLWTCSGNSNIDERKFIYAYYTEPDSLMHEFGRSHEKFIKKMQYINTKTEELCNNLKDTLIIVTADQGHIDFESIVLEDHPELQNMLIRETSLEPRAINFFVKNDKLEEFKIIFR